MPAKHVDSKYALRNVRGIAVAALTALALVAMVPGARADVVIDYDNVAFSFGDGGTGAGSFYLDTSNNTISGLSITTTGGTAFDGATYSDSSLATATLLGPSQYQLNFYGSDASGTDSMLQLDVGPPLQPDAPIVLTASSGEFVDNTELRVVTSGVLGDFAPPPVPEPSAAWLFGTMLVLGAWASGRFIRT